MAQTPPKLQTSEDWGYPCGIGTKHISNAPIQNNSAPTHHPKDSGGRPGFSRKYHVTAATEAPELRKLRERSGFKTPNPIDHILPPPKSGFDPERIIPQPKTGKGKPGDWHGNVTRDGTHTRS
jgi:hypothetical protein